MAGVGAGTGTNASSYLFGFASGEINKESVMDAIILTSPFDTPFLQMAPKVPATQTTEYWIEDTLNATNIGGLLEGRNFGASAVVAPVRKSNHTQIFGKDLQITMTQMHLQSYGFQDAMAHEVRDGVREVMRNIEKKVFAASGASATGSITPNERLMKTLEDYIISNKYTATSTALGGSTTTQVSATALHEHIFNSLLQKVYEDGGNPDFVFVPPATKRQISSWQGSPTNTSTAAIPTTHNLQQGGSQLGRSITSYLSDFAMLNIVLDRWVPQASNTAADDTDLSGRLFLLDLARCEVAFLRPVAMVPMATAGDHVRAQITGELTLRVLAQSHMGIITGISERMFI